MATIVTQSDDSAVKIRAIIDLLPERVILPRPTDVAAGVVNTLLSQWRARRYSPEVASKKEEKDFGMELGAVDFSDALYTW